MSLRFGKHLLLLLGTTLIVTGAPAQAADEDVPREYRVKAAFIQRFLEFVTWTGHADRDGPVLIGVVGDSPMRGALQLLVAEPGAGRELRLCAPAELIDAGQGVLFVSGTIDGKPRADHPEWGDLQAYLDGGVLTIGEDDRFHEAGGVINFFAQDERLRFSISRRAVQDAGLTIGSKLMRLARIED